MPPNLNSDYLLQHAQTDDAAVLPTLLREHYAGVRRFAALLLGDEKKAGAAAIETFAQAMRIRTRYQGQASVAAWLYAITRRLCRKNKQKAPPIALPENDRLPITHTINTLAPTHRTLILLRYLDDLPARDLAYALGLREKRVECFLQQARADLLPNTEAPPSGRAHRKTAPQTWHILDQTVQFGRPPDPSPGLEYHLNTCDSCRAHAQHLHQQHTHLHKTLHTAYPRQLTPPSQVERLAAAVQHEIAVQPDPIIPGLSKELVWIGGLIVVVALGLLFFSFSGGAASGQALFPTPTPLGGLPAQPNYTGDQPALAAEGRWLAYTAANLVLYDLETGQTANDIIPAKYEKDGSASLSADGRWIAFLARTANAGESNCAAPSQPERACAHVYLHDRETGQTEQVSQGQAIPGASGESYSPAISADGNWIAYWFAASNLVPDDTQTCGEGDAAHNCLDLFIYHRETGQTTRIPIGRPHDPENPPLAPALTADGQLILLQITAADQIAPELNLPNPSDLYLYDQQTAAFEPLNLAPDGAPGNAPALLGALSADGTLIAFVSRASNLVPGDTNRKTDIFLRDRAAGTTTRLSLAPGGDQPNGHSGVRAPKAPTPGEQIALSSDGRWLVYPTRAANLMPGSAPWWCGPPFSPCANLILHDLQMGKTTPLIPTPAPNSRYTYPGISADGRWITYVTDIVDCDDVCTSVWLHDTQTGAAIRIKITP